MRSRHIVIGVILALLCCRASYWQWTRHLEKKSLIENLSARIDAPIVAQETLIQAGATPTIPRDDADLLYRRITLSGTYDFSHEVILRNRSFQDEPGVFVFTPMKLDRPSSTDGVDYWILVNRGFLPLPYASKDKRAPFQTTQQASFTGLIKNSMHDPFLGPQDPVVKEGSTPASGWIDAFLRIDISNIQKQMPYQLLPFYVEVMNAQDANAVMDQVVEKKSGRDDILFMPNAGSSVLRRGELIPGITYPRPAFDTFIPPGRHFGYVFEWLFIGLLVLAVTVLIEFQKRRRERGIVTR